MASESAVVFQTQLKATVGEQTRQFSLTLTSDTLSWEPVSDQQNKSSGDGNVAAAESVVSTRVSWILKTEIGDPGTKGQGENSGDVTLDIHYAVRTNRPDYSSDLSMEKVTFEGSKDNCEQLVQAVWEEMPKKVPNRPKSLLVIVNPKSGSGKAKKIFQKQVAPIFELCGIKLDVIESIRPKYADEVLDQYDLSKVDGLVSVGGDGTFTEVVNALMKRTMKDAGIDENNPEAALKTPSLTCSMIAGGSANGHPLPVFVGFSKDPVSSAVMIAIGHTETFDVMTIHCGQKFMRYTLLLLGHGQMARAMDMMENNRWAGPARYLALPFCLLVSRKLIDVEVDYLPADTDSSKAAETTEESAQGAAISSDGESGWKTIAGKYQGVSCTLISCFSPIYAKPYATSLTTRDGKIYLFMDKPCGRMQQIKFFQKLKNMDHTAFEADFMQCFEVKAYRVRAVGAWKDDKSALALNWDGDMLYCPEPHFETRIHKGLLTVFGRDDCSELCESDPDVVKYLKGSNSSEKREEQH